MPSTGKLGTNLSAFTKEAIPSRFHNSRMCLSRVPLPTQLSLDEQQYYLFAIFDFAFIFEAIIQHVLVHIVLTQPCSIFNSQVDVGAFRSIFSGPFGVEDADLCTCRSEIQVLDCSFTKDTNIESRRGGSGGDKGDNTSENLHGRDLL